MPNTTWQDEVVTDPTDFGSPDDIPLRMLDSSLRCPVCKDFFNAPVLLINCGHSFCSMCIRKMFIANQSKQTCPVCKETIASEMQLKKNTALEDAVLTWKSARDLVFKYASKANKSNSNDTTPRKSLKRSHSVSLSPESSSRRASSRDKQYPSNSSDGTPVSATVACPICGNTLRLEIMGEHVDSGCTFSGTESKENRERWANFLPGCSNAPSKSKSKGRAKPQDRHIATEGYIPVEPLALLPYDVMKDKDIRSALRKYGLSIEGSSEMRISRHKQFTALFNANLDSKCPRPLSELKKELNQWENDLMKSKVKFQKNKEVTEDTTNYLKEHSDDFKSLIRAVRERDKRRKITIPSNISSEAVDITPSPTSGDPDGFP